METNPPLPLGRWFLLLGLLLVEISGVAQCFDPDTLRRELHWGLRLQRYPGWFLHVSVVAGIVAVLYRGSKGLSPTDRRVLTTENRHHRRLYLAAHLVGLTGLLALTLLMFGSEGGYRSWLVPAAWPGLGARSATAPGWRIAWATAGALTFGFWLAALVSPRAWPTLARLSWAGILLGLAVAGLGWVSGYATGLLWIWLSIGTFRVVEALLHVLGQEVISVPSKFQIGTPVFHVEIFSPCSGYEGIGLIWVFLGVYLGLYRKVLRFPRVLVLVPIGTAAIWLSNAVRITALVMVGTYGSAAVAIGGFHSQAGWLLFNAVALGLILLVHRTPWFRTDLSDDKQTGANPTTAYLGPLLALVGTMMLTGAFSSGFDSLYPLRIVAAALLLWHFRSQYTDLRWTVSWEAVAIGTIVFAIWILLEPPLTAETPLTAWLRGVSPAVAVAWVSVRVLGSTVVVPLAEELAFRGFLVRRLVRSDFTEVPPGTFTWTSFVVSSVLFGGLHGRWLAGILAGLLFALALYRRRELADAVVAHMTSNALIAATVLLAHAWSLWN